MIQEGANNLLNVIDFVGREAWRGIWFQSFDHIGLGAKMYGEFCGVSGGECWKQVNALEM